jgi:hypothetical protein
LRRSKGLVLWKKIYLIVVFVILVIPYSLLVFVPSTTGKVVSYFASPEMGVFWIGLIILVGVSFVKKYAGVRQSQSTPEE